MIGRFLNADDTDTMLEHLNDSLISTNLYAYCLNNPVNMVDSNGYLPKWLTTTLKITAGLAIIAAGVALTAVTFGAGAPLTVVVTAAAVGMIVGTCTNLASQYFRNGKSFRNINIDSIIMSGVQGGLSGVLSTTGIGVLGQIIGNALISGGGSSLKGDKLLDVVFNSLVGGLAGFAGGNGTGYGGLYFSEALRNKDLMAKFLLGLMKSGAVANSPDIVKAIKEAVKKLQK